MNMNDTMPRRAWDVVFLYSGAFRTGAITGAEIAESAFLRASIRAGLFRSMRVFSRLSPDGVDRLSTYIGIDPADRSVTFLPIEELGPSTRALPPTLALCPYTFQHQLDPLRIERPFPISGFVHSISDLDAKVGIAKNLRMPYSRYDTALCPSRSVRIALHAIAAEISSDDGVMPTTHVVPLGVDGDTFGPDGAADGAARREALGIGVDDCAFLYVGRLSPWTKMDLLPLLDAFARACQATTRPLRLLLVGQEQASGYAEMLRARAVDLGIANRVAVLDGMDRIDLPALFAAANCFVSPSDNRQETFGLTLVEAMASSLPIIAADWNGYRDVVGDAGLLVPTIVARANHDLANDLLYRGSLPIGAHFSQLTAVSLAGMTAAMTLLADDTQLRESLGAAGLARYRLHFQWSRVLAQLLPIWAGQIHAVAAAGEHRNRRPELTIDNERCFGHYPSRSWSQNMTIRPRRAPTIVHDRILAGIAGVAAIDWPLCLRLRAAIDAEPGIALSDLERLEGKEDGAVARSIAFLTKHGLVDFDWDTVPTNLAKPGSDEAQRVVETTKA